MMTENLTIFLFPNQVARLAGARARPDLKISKTSVGVFKIFHIQGF